MNIGEANAWFQFLRGLQSGATENDIDRALEAADHLTQRANKTLGAGPRPEQTAQYVADLIDAVDVATDWGLPVLLNGRPVTTSEPAGEVL